MEHFRHELEGMAKANKTAEWVFIHLGLRYRDTRSTNLIVFRRALTRNKKAPWFSDADYRGIFTQLGNLGVGTIQGNIFKWNYSIKQAAILALGEKSALTEKRAPRTTPPIKPEPNTHVIKTKDYIIKIIVTPITNIKLKRLIKRPNVIRSK